MGVYQFSPNLPAPINEGPDPQTKKGNLIIEGVLRLGQFTTANAPAGAEGALYFDITKNTTMIYSSSTWSGLGGGTGQLPVYTTTQRNALSPVEGQQIYNTTENTVQVFGQTAWKTVAAKLALAATCSLDGNCDSTHCADGVCCNTSCEGGCAACNLTETIGTCVVRSADDTTESPTACQRCNGTNTTFQPQTAADGYLCTGKCNYCIAGTCAVRVADDVTETPTACQRCDGTNTTFQPQTANDGYLCSDKCNKCNVGICTVRAANDTTESPAICYYCDGVNSATVAAPDNTQMGGCTEHCKKCFSGSCVNQVEQDLFGQCTGNCDVCNGSICTASASLCTGNCDTCSGSGTAYSCVASDSLCTGNCDVCSGSGTAYSCAASNALCSNTTASCSCSGSGTVFNCSSCPDTYGLCGYPTCSSYTCGNVPENGVACATCKTCSSGTCSIFVANGLTGLNCTATHYRCNGSGGCTAPCGANVNQVGGYITTYGGTAASICASYCSCVNWSSNCLGGGGTWGTSTNCNENMCCGNTGWTCFVTCKSWMY